MPKLPEPGNNSPIFPNGTYKVKIQSYERTKAKTGTQQIRWKAEIVEPKEHAGRIIVDHTPLTEASVWKVSNLINACGISFQSGVDTDSAYFDGLCKSTLGRNTFWLNEQGTYNGQSKNQIIAYQMDDTQEVVKYAEDTPEWLN